MNLKAFIELYESANDRCAMTIKSVEENSYTEALAERASCVVQFRELFPSSMKEAKENFMDFDCGLFYDIIIKNPELLVSNKLDSFIADIRNTETEDFYIPSWKSVIKS